MVTTLELLCIQPYSSSADGTLIFTNLTLPQVEEVRVIWTPLFYFLILRLYVCQ
jgi:hypothetical protein